MMEWPTVPIIKVAPPQPASLKFKAEQKVWLLSLDQIESDTGYIVNKQIVPAGQAGSSTFIFDKGNVLYSKLRPYLNKVIWPQEPGIATSELIPLRPNQKYLDCAYLTYYLRSKHFLSFAEKRVAGAKMPRVIMTEFWQHCIPLPTLSEQRCIVEILDQADALRKKRSEADDKAERILPALFIKMFGDPATNPKGWDFSAVEKLFSPSRHGTRCGPFGSALKRHEYVDNGIPVWGIDNVKENQFVESGSLFITKAKYKELVSYSVEPGDILISRAGTVGRMCVARPEQSPSIIGTNLIRLSLDSAKIAPEYFTTLFSCFPERVSRLRANVDEKAYSFMNTTALKLLRVPLPPIKLQNEFASRMKAVEGLKAKRINSLNYLDTLFQTLLYRAFSGKLTAKWREAHLKELLAEMELQMKELDAASPQTALSF